MMVPSLALLLACPGEEETPVPADRFADFVFVENAPVGDISCFDGTNWVVSEADPACLTTNPLDGTVEDFETGDEVPDATVEIFYSNDVTGTADITQVSDASGKVAVDVETCKPVAYQVTTDFDETKRTIETNQIFDQESPVVNSFNSVSSVTYRLIPSLLGVSVDADKGVLAGTVYGCGGEGTTVENAQVVVKNAAGEIPDSLVVKYFYDEFPNRNEPDTSADGLWVAINVPAGDWTVEAWVADGEGGHTLIGKTSLTVFADSINISNIYTGSETGIRYPDSCLDCSK